MLSLSDLRRSVSSFLSGLSGRGEDSFDSPDPIAPDYKPASVLRTFFAKDIEPHYADKIPYYPTFDRSHINDYEEQIRREIARCNDLLSIKDFPDYLKEGRSESKARLEAQFASVQQTKLVTRYVTDDSIFVNSRIDNGLLRSVIEAHACHQGVVLVPEHFLFTILHGVCRYLFVQDSKKVKPEDRQPLEVRIGYETQSTAINVDVIAERLIDDVGSKDQLAQKIVQSVSLLTDYRECCTPLNITMLEAFNARYNYSVYAYCCGIRRIDIEGSRSDWLSIGGFVSKLMEIEELAELKIWLLTVRTVLERIALYDESDPASREWLHRILQYEPICSAPSKASGWIANLFPFEGTDTLRTDFHIEGSDKMYEIPTLDSHPMGEALVRYRVAETNDEFEIKLVSGLRVTDSIERESSIHMYRPEFRYGIWTDVRS